MKQPGNSYRENISEAEALHKAMRFCSYQERCIRDLQDAFKRWGVKAADQDIIIDRLIEEDYLNEQRFADLFVSGKFRIKNWGRMKITGELRLRNVNDEVIQKAMRKIDKQDYLKTAQTLIQKKAEELSGLPDLQLNNKVMWYMVGKGYEKEIVFDIFRSMK